MNVQGSFHVRLPNLGRVYLLQPVAGRDGRCHVKIQPLQGIVHIGVLVHSPISTIEIVIHEFHAIQDELPGISGMGALFPV